MILVKANPILPRQKVKLKVEGKSRKGSVLLADLLFENLVKGHQKSIVEGARPVNQTNQEKDENGNTQTRRMKVVIVRKKSRVRSKNTNHRDLSQGM